MVNSNKNYVNTERAHYMCPNMHFWILAQIKSNYDKVQVMHSVKALQKSASVFAKSDRGRKRYEKAVLSIAGTLGYNSDDRNRSGLVAAGL